MIGAILLVAFLLLLGLGVPVVVVLLLVTFAAFLSMDVGTFAMAQRTVVGVDSFILLAIPLFILTGSLMNATGMSRRLFTFAGTIVGHWRGGLAQVNVMTSIFMGGISGSSTADAAVTARVLVPAMVRAGYDPGFSGAITATSSMVSPIIPPSIAMIIYGTLANVSIGALFVAGVIPGIFLGVSLSIYVAIVSRRRNFGSGDRAPLREVWKAAGSAGLGLLVPIIIVGGIRFGIMTPTEAGALAVIYVLLVGLVFYREIRLFDLPRILREAVLDSGVILVIIAAASPLGWLLTVRRVPQAIAGSVGALTDNPVLFLLAVNVILLIAGALVESTAVMIMLTPVLAPIAVAVGVDPVHFGIVLIVNLMVGTVSPPFGNSVFVTAAIAQIPVESIFAAILRILPVVLLVLLVLTYLPGSYLWAIDLLG